ncbi:MAG: cytochrome C oxidase subunit IV family protein [Novosphingobium sp.]
MTGKIAGARNAWLLLLAISAVSFLAAELMGERHVAIGAIMLIAAAKIAVILSRFMEVERAPKAIGRYLYGWTIGVAVIVFAMWWVAALG